MTGLWAATVLVYVVNPDLPWWAYVLLALAVVMDVIFERSVVSE